MEPLISISDLGVKFHLRKQQLLRQSHFFAIRDITFNIHKKATFCLIGESGSGKTTLVRAILGLHRYQEGEITYKGQPIKRHHDMIHKELISNAQMVFQDPVSSLSPFLTLSQSIEEPLRTRGIGKKKRGTIVEKLAEQTNLSMDVLRRKPSKASDGQNQRACIARALSTRPEMLFLDEPLTTLDAITHKQVSELLCRVKEQYDLTFFLITHDLGLVKKIGTTVAVMYLGRIVEKAPVADFFSKPLHPYSRALLSSVLKPGIWKNKRIILEGEIQSQQYPPSGCVFHPRCYRKCSICKSIVPPFTTIGPDHEVCCHLYDKSSGISG
ncbi:MAG: ABC transporter ATP-binding protein [Candidatus Latescibacteria bacterium]|jgi:oligopeptide/dipeptide ABC transporter ATP-binding protein|nr:ABC transporter ATP-binding protein [Candidatus Latescibacterota bacterium]